MMRTPLLIVGKSAAGKTSLSKRLTEDGRTYVSASGILRNSLNLVANKASRRSLADLGERLRKESSLQAFHSTLIAAINDVDGGTVVDGIRFAETADQLLSIGTNPALIFLDCPDEVRRQRLEDSGRGADWEWLSTHPTELSVDEMRTHAHLVLDGTSDPLCLLQTISTFLESGHSQQI